MAEKEDEGTVKANPENGAPPATQKPKPKPRLELVVLGDSSSGKSTLTGHLICKLNGVDDKVMEALKKAGEDCNTQGPPEYALVMDHFAHARRAGAGASSPSGLQCGPYWSIESEAFRLSITEVPGDREFLKNATAVGLGGNSADAAILSVSAAPGEFERGIKKDGLTREHALLAHVLGVQQLIVCVTKMDASAPDAWCQERFENVKKKTEQVLQAMGFPADVPFVPVCGKSGENLTQPPNEKRFSWWKGPTLLQMVDGLQPPIRPVHAPLRVSVREAYHVTSVGAVAQGQVEAGVLRFGAQVTLVPGGISGKVRTVEIDNEAVREAHPRDVVSFVIENVRVADLRRGMVACEANRPAVEAETFLARIIVLSGPGEVTEGFCPTLAIHSTNAVCRVEELVARLDRSTGEEVEQKPETIRVGECGLVRFRPELPLCVEAHNDCPALGQFMTTRDQTAILMMGVVSEVQARIRSS